VLTLPIAQIVADTEAEGPGRRFAVWVQGCPLRCAGCCNPEMLRFGGGTPTAVVDLAARVRATPGIEGVSLLGGEPFAHAEGCAAFADEVRRAGLGVMVYSGFTREEIEARIADGDVAAAELLRATDLLVDGRYERAQPETRRRWIGSSNQRMHFLSSRYDPTDPVFVRPNTVELRLKDGELVVNGWPALAAAVVPRTRWSR
jgi:anaerobic ribonucleoside-triphosphate reductase activating protein